MEIDPYLAGQIKDGKVILFLGAGASYDAVDAHGVRPPLGPKLGEMLADKFLGGKYRDYPLDQIGEYAISQSNLNSVQYYIRDIFEKFQPTDAHRLVSTFRWKSIVTTNYDLVIERAYEGNNKSVQDIKTIVENGDSIEDRLSDPRAVAYLKIHGCISRLTNPNCPLILSKDQYVTARQGRSRVFDHLFNWAIECPILFVGYRVDDSDMRALMNQIVEVNPNRPRYYAVSPGMDDIQTNLLGSKRITGIKGTFSDFMEALDRAIPSPFRGLAPTTARPNLPIFEKLERNAELHPQTLNFLVNDVDYVKSLGSETSLNPVDFYKGVNPGWSAIAQNLDVRFELTDEILSDHFLSDEADHLDRMELVLIKSHAGAGKSILMRRIAWEAAKKYDRLCLYMKEHGVINVGAIQEIIQQSGSRVYLFIDDAGDFVKEIQSLSKNIGAQGGKLTVVVAERINEWNVACGPIKTLVTDTHELGYLKIEEIDNLLLLLEEHQALGTLGDASLADRRKAFEERASRQLLVALHEATYGKSFVDIVKDEYDNIKPYEAQRIYLDVCVLNRLDVPVRAGIISRLHNIRFEQFEQRFFGPLEHVVKSSYDHVIGDNVYTARHSHIAEMVFDSIFSENQEEKFDAYVRCLSQLNVDYACDRKAFRQMIRGSNVVQLFPNHELGKRVFEVARKQVGDSGQEFICFLHQLSIYEMKRQNGNLHHAADWLSQAIRLAPTDLSLKHTMAGLRIRCAEEASRSELQKEKFLDEAIALGKFIVSAQKGDSYGHHILLRAWMSRLQAIITADSPTLAADVQQVSKEIERILADGLQQFTDDPFLRGVESEFASLLSQRERALASLLSAFAGNKRNASLALRLVEHYREKEDFVSAKGVLKEALNANPNEQKLHFGYADLLLMTGGSNDEIAFHLKRSFVPGDRRYTAQLLYGRQLFINNDFQASRELFQKLRDAKLNPEVRDELRYAIDQRFRGKVTKVEPSYCILQREDLGDRVFASKHRMSAQVWRRLVNGSRVTFSVAFSMKGPGGFDVELET